ncbi:MAG: nitroreductase family protein [Sulfurimonas sp.]|nr:nitroreductase family protein [Sulfurimonas sp.]
MNEVYEESSLTPLRVAQLSGYRDWSSQPCMFKHYPNFLYRYRYGENPSLRPIELCRIITSTHNSANQPYIQLSTPSAGNLHPVELYVQIRGIKGVISGIYHVNAGEGALVLIKEIESDGLESLLGIQKRISGFIFVVSCVAFRAEWKYAKRAVRYCYLDIGHQVGAVGASLKLHGQEMTILSDFDIHALHKVMGFGGDEFVCAVMTCGEIGSKSVANFKQDLMVVSPSDYSELTSYTREILTKCEPIKSPIMSVETSLHERDILQRRSTRIFDTEPLTQTQQKRLIYLLNKEHYPLSCFHVILKETLYKRGVYHNQVLLKEGDFTTKMISLLVDQSFVKNAEVITVVCSKYFSSNTLMQAGAYGHVMYLQTQAEGIGCSGIGAFYDKKLQEFLGTQEYILYVLAFGKEKKGKK